MAVFFDMPVLVANRINRISVIVKARVVNRKPVDVAASTSFRLSRNSLIAHCTK